MEDHTKEVGETSQPEKSKDIELPRTGQSPLRFKGCLLTEATTYWSNEAKSKEAPRWHHLALYKTAGGNHILAITYNTSRLTKEFPHFSVYPLGEDLQALEETLINYDPLTYFLGFPPGKIFEERQQRLKRELVAAYKNLVTRFLSRIQNIGERID